MGFYYIVLANLDVAGSCPNATNLREIIWRAASPLYWHYSKSSVSVSFS